MMRYGECVLDVQKDPSWLCPSCRDVCNCSFCRSAKGWAPTGNMYRAALEAGYDSVAHMLVTLYQKDSEAPGGELEQSLKEQIETLPKRGQRKELSSPNRAASPDEGGKQNSNASAVSSGLKSKASPKVPAGGKMVVEHQAPDAGKANGNILQMMGMAGARQIKRGRSTESVEVENKRARGRGRPKGKADDGKGRPVLAQGNALTKHVKEPISLAELDAIGCEMCTLKTDESLMILCDGCDKGFHTFCIGLGRRVPAGNFFCMTCDVKSRGAQAGRANARLSVST